MVKKKKQKKNKQQNTSLLSAGEVKQLDALLENTNKIDIQNLDEQIQNPQFMQVLVEKLPSDNPKILQVVLAIRDAYPDKNVQKAVKKTLFKLKQRGVQIPNLESDITPALILKAPQKEAPSAYVGPIDGTGSRGVMIKIPQVPKGVNIGIGIVSADEGIAYFIYGEYSKKQAKDVKALFYEQTDGWAVETSISHVATILEKAYAKNNTGSSEATEGYLQIRPWILEQATLLDRPVIDDFISSDSISKEILTELMLDKLLEHELMESWLIDPEKMEPIFEEISEAEESPILISEAQKSDRIREIKDKAIADIYPDSKRLELKDSLEEMAYIFYKQDEEEYTRLSLLAASSLEQTNYSLATNPFLKALLDHNINYYIEKMGELDLEPEDEDERESSPCLIIP